MPNFEGTEVKMRVTLSGDELKMVDPNPSADLNQGRVETVYRRAK
jgi:hypothetical protein